MQPFTFKNKGAVQLVQVEKAVQVLQLLEHYIQVPPSR